MKNLLSCLLLVFLVFASATLSAGVTKIETSPVVFSNTVTVSTNLGSGLYFGPSNSINVVNGQLSVITTNSGGTVTTNPIVVSGSSNSVGIITVSNLVFKGAGFTNIFTGFTNYNGTTFWCRVWETNSGLYRTNFDPEF